MRKCNARRKARRAVQNREKRKKIKAKKFQKKLRRKTSWNLVCIWVIDSLNVYSCSDFFYSSENLGILFISIVGWF